MGKIIYLHPACQAEAGEGWTNLLRCSLKEGYALIKQSHSLSFNSSLRETARILLRVTVD